MAVGTCNDAIPLLAINNRGNPCPPVFVILMHYVRLIPNTAESPPDYRFLKDGQ
jgi:hypothetical protein